MTTRAKPKAPAAPWKFAVGDVVWRLDGNHRVYVEGFSEPDPDRFWEQCRIEEIVRRSYVVAYLDKHGKPYGTSKVARDSIERTYRTTAEKDFAVYAALHLHRIVEGVRRTDAATLRRVAEAIGYDDTATSLEQLAAQERERSERECHSKVCP